MAYETADVVIIGAGVIGCSTAYHLARLGLSNVVVVEMEQVGAGTSGKSAAMLSLQFYSNEPSARMAQYAYARYMEFEQELGTPIDFKRTGWLSLATAPVAEELRQGAETLQALGIETELLTPEEVKQRCPEVNVDDIVLGAYGPADGSFDPHMIMWGYINRARELGVRLRQGVRATGLRIAGGRATGIETSAGLVAAPVVVNAAGPWAIEVGRWAGVEIPLLNMARSIVVTGPFPAIPSDRAFVEDVAAGWYYRPEGPGVLMGMGKTPTAEFDVPFRIQVLDEMIEVAVHRVPVLAEAPFLTGWTGVRPLTVDNLPILGPTPGVEGLVLNCGWGGTGIIQAPVAGRLIAEYIRDGRAMTFDLTPFRMARFCGESTTAAQGGL